MRLSCKEELCNFSISSGTATDVASMAASRVGMMTRGSATTNLSTNSARQSRAVFARAKPIGMPP